MTAVWTTIGVLAFVCAGIKAAGPLAVGGRRFPVWADRVIAFLPPALLSALIVVETFTSDGALVVDGRAVGLAAAIAAVSVRAPMVVVVVVAAAATAAARALGAA